LVVRLRIPGETAEDGTGEKDVAGSNEGDEGEETIVVVGGTVGAVLEETFEDFMRPDEEGGLEAAGAEEEGAGFSRRVGEGDWEAAGWTFLLRGSMGREGERRRGLRVLGERSWGCSPLTACYRARRKCLGGWWSTCV
jgi:hypothetical protein